MGLILGWKLVLIALFLSYLFGAVVGLVVLILKKGDRKTMIPFGPFLVMGTFLVLVWGEQLLRLYLSWVGM